MGFRPPKKNKTSPKKINKNSRTQGVKKFLEGVKECFLPFSLAYALVFFPPFPQKKKKPPKRFQSGYPLFSVFFFFFSGYFVEVSSFKDVHSECDIWAVSTSSEWSASFGWGRHSAILLSRVQAVRLSAFTDDLWAVFSHSVDHKRASGFLWASCNITFSPAAVTFTGTLSHVRSSRGRCLALCFVARVSVSDLAWLGHFRLVKKLRGRVVKSL